LKNCEIFCLLPISGEEEKRRKSFGKTCLKIKLQEMEELFAAA
jgi:hypothetical protein